MYLQSRIIEWTVRVLECLALMVTMSVVLHVKALKKLSIISAKWADSSASMSPVRRRALVTDSLRTYARNIMFMYINVFLINAYLTCAAKSTLIFEIDVSDTCSCFSFGNNRIPTAACMSRSYRSLTCSHLIAFPLHWRMPHKTENTQQEQACENHTL